MARVDPVVHKGSIQSLDRQYSDNQQVCREPGQEHDWSPCCDCEAVNSAMIII